MGPMCRERNPCGAWHVRIKPKCTRVAVVGGFAIRVGAARLLSREENPLRTSSQSRCPLQRYDDPLEQCISNLPLSSCDSPARPDGSARAPMTNSWLGRHQRISWIIEDRVTRVGESSTYTCGLHPMIVVAGTSPWRGAPGGYAGQAKTIRGSTRGRDSP